MFTGDPVRFGFPKPDYKIYESHPIVNSLILHHLGHGDIGGRGRTSTRLDGDGVAFADGSRTPYDVIVLATGYHLHYPFLEPGRCCAGGPRERAGPLPQHLHAGGPRTSFVLGMIEASGIGWQGRYEQAELVASYLAARGDDLADGGRASSSGSPAAARPVGRLPLPRARADVLLRQQGRLPPRGARGDRSGCA